MTTPDIGFFQNLRPPGSSCSRHQFRKWGTCPCTPRSELALSLTAFSLPQGRSEYLLLLLHAQLPMEAAPCIKVNLLCFERLIKSWCEIALSYRADSWMGPGLSSAFLLHLAFPGIEIGCADGGMFWYSNGNFCWKCGFSTPLWATNAWKGCVRWALYSSDTVS